MRLVRGDQLTPPQRAAVLRSFVHRLTIENRYPRWNPTGARIAPVSDDEWLREHAFYITDAGTLANRPRFCEVMLVAEAIWESGRYQP